MPIVWRVSRPDSAHVLHGGDSEKQGGRWNSPARTVIYTAENLSLAALECFVNLPMKERLAMPEMAAVGIEIPEEEPLTVTRAQLEAICRGGADEDWCRGIGDRWLDEGRHFALIAPSVVVPRERNYMLNAAHRAIGSARIVIIEPHRFDARLVDGRTHTGAPASNPAPR